MRLGIMQPYFFPYIGYFQLIKAVDKFVFYDDVNFINRGWINRNRILINGNATYLTVQLKDASQNKLIKDVEFTDNKSKLKKTIELTYKKSPYFYNVWPIIETSLDTNTDLISQLGVESIKQVCNFLGIKTTFELSSNSYSQTKGLEKADRLIQICKANEADIYINPIGGQELYSKEEFAKNELTLNFIKSKPIIYSQFRNEFVSGLSIIDVMMFNSIAEISKMLDNYELT